MSTASAQTPRVKLASLADLLAIPEEQRFHEILDGELVRKELASPRHGLGQSRMSRVLEPFDRKPNGPTRPGGWWILTEVTLELAIHQIERPDLAGWRRERIPTVPEAYPLRVPPDWICEVIAGSDARRRDGVQKRRIYAEHGVGHYWLLDMEREVLTVLRLTERGYVEVQEAGRSERIRAEPFAAVELPLAVLFGEDAE